MQPPQVVLSSGPAGGYYSRLGKQIDHSSQTTVEMAVKNLETQGSQENLQNLLTKRADFALIQLDVAEAAMRQGQVQAVAVLGNEHVHVITRTDSPLKSFADLQGKRVAIGAPGSGIRHTATELVQAGGITLQADNSSFIAALDKLKTRQLDAVFYVGSIGASERLRQDFAANPVLQIIPLQSSLVNYLTVRDAGSYQAATIPVGTYNVKPPIPERDIPTLSTATVIVTRPDVDRRQVGLLTWAILANSRKYALFYPELETDDARSLLQKGLYYIHPAAQEVYTNGDPRSAWIRYWENNNDLQAGLVILLGSSGIGLFLRHWRKERSKKLITTTIKRINELRQLLPHEAQQALRGIDELSQEHRLMFIDGIVSPDIYEGVRQKTQFFADQCHKLLEEQRRKFIMDTLLLLDDWQANLQTNPKEALQKLSQIKHQYREMLLSDQVDIEAYIELVQLTLMSLMTLAPNQRQEIEWLEKEIHGDRS
jgi:TRAP transporter TAXI family solute receptor